MSSQFGEFRDCETCGDETVAIMIDGDLACAACQTVIEADYDPNP